VTSYGILAAGLVGIAVGAAYGYVGFRIFGRSVPQAARLAAYQFSLWWYGLSATTAIGGLEGILIASNGLSFPLAFTLYLITLLLDCALLWGLVGYLTYIYTGRYHLVLLSTFYAALYVAALYFVIAQAPYGVVIRRGLPVLQYGSTGSLALLGFIAFGILVPELAGVALYLSLYFKTTNRTQRFRIGFVGLGILLWFGLAAITPPSSVADPVVWTIAKAILGGVAALIVLAAYNPPLWLRRRYGVDLLEEPDISHRGEISTR
jgi:hypothetical protein